MAYFKTTTLFWPSKPGACSILEDVWVWVLRAASWENIASWLLEGWNQSAQWPGTWRLRSRVDRSQAWRVKSQLLHSDSMWQRLGTAGVRWLDSQFRGLCEGSWLQTTEANLIGLTKKRCFQRCYAVHRISRKARELAMHLGIMLKDYYRTAYKDPTTRSLGPRLHLQLAPRLGTGCYCLTLCHYCFFELVWPFLKVVNKQSSWDVECCHHLIFNHGLRVHYPMRKTKL